MVLPDEVGEFDIRSEAAEEVGPQREQDQCASLGVPRLVDEHVDEGAPLVFGDAGGEQLFELVDGEHEAVSGR